MIKQIIPVFASGTILCYCWYRYYKIRGSYKTSNEMFKDDNKSSAVYDSPATGNFDEGETVNPIYHSPVAVSVAVQTDILEESDSMKSKFETLNPVYNPPVAVTVAVKSDYHLIY